MTANPAADDYWQLVGARVRAARRQQGLTQRALAKSASVSFSTLQAIEVGRRRGGPRHATLAALAVALKVPVEQFTGGGAPVDAPLFTSGDDAHTAFMIGSFHHEAQLVARAYTLATTEARQRVQQVLIIDEAGRRRDPDLVRSVAATDRLTVALNRLRELDAGTYTKVVDAFTDHVNATLQQQTAVPAATATPAVAGRKRR